MTEKTVGYVELEWTCKRCGTRNPGTKKTCSGCGSAMSERDQFEAPVQQELITDKEKLAQAERGPDVHCPYCSARNPAGSEKCVQCGAELKGAVARETGGVLGAFGAGPAPELACPYCATPNPANAVKCKKCGGNLQKPAAPPAQAAGPLPGGLPMGLIIGGVVAVILLCVVIGYLASRTTEQIGVVQSARWERAIQVEAMGPVEHEDWEDEIPAGAQKGTCTKKYRKTQSEPAPGAEEVCGTPYTKDQGSGIGKVVQDCEYKIYDNSCKYTVNEWKVVDKAIAQGNDLNPAWPTLRLQADQREGKRDEKYQVTFEVDDKQGTYTYNVDSAAEFSKFTNGSRWTLKINTFGAVSDAQPAR